MTQPGAEHNREVEADLIPTRLPPEASDPLAETDEVRAPTPDSTEYMELDLDGLNEDANDESVEELMPDDAASLSLELAAVRAEAKRLAHAEEELQRSVRLRDGWLSTMRDELTAVESERNALAAKIAEVTSHNKELQELVATLKIDLDALRAAEPSSGQYEAPVEFDPEHPPQLEPLDYEAPAIKLDQKVYTVGRTNESDVCVPSSLVSRDHARILVSATAVTVIDIGSVNGCFVNQRQVKKQVLRNGDVLRFADRAYRFALRAA